jgi:hypothetical protein
VSFALHQCCNTMVCRSAIISQAKLAEDGGNFRGDKGYGYTREIIDKEVGDRETQFTKSIVEAMRTILGIVHHPYML